MVKNISSLQKNMSVEEFVKEILDELKIDLDKYFNESLEEDEKENFYIVAFDDVSSLKEISLINI